MPILALKSTVFTQHKDKICFMLNPYEKMN